MHFGAAFLPEINLIETFTCGVLTRLSLIRGGINPALRGSRERRHAGPLVFLRDALAHGVITQISYLLQQSRRLRLRSMKGTSDLHAKVARPAARLVSFVFLLTEIYLVSATQVSRAGALHTTALAQHDSILLLCRKSGEGNS